MLQSFVQVKDFLVSVTTTTLRTYYGVPCIEILRRRYHQHTTENHVQSVELKRRRKDIEVIINTLTLILCPIIGCKYFFFVSFK